MDRASLVGFRLAAALVPLLAAGAALGQDDDEAFDRTPRDCLITQTIDQTDAIDDQNIIFYMRGSKVYRNHLPRKCPGLERENRIAWQTHSSRLCSIDQITVLEDFGGTFRPGFTCRLGEFVPMSAAEVEELELREDGEGAQSSLETSEVEIEREGDAEPGEGEAAGEGSPPDEAVAEPPETEN
jgi:hypothetical protein